MPYGWSPNGLLAVFTCDRTVSPDRLLESDSIITTAFPLVPLLTAAASRMWGTDVVLTVSPHSRTFAERVILFFVKNISACLVETVHGYYALQLKL